MTLDTTLLVFGLGLIGMALFAVASTVRNLSVTVGKQAQQIAQLELDVKAALILARKRLVAGRSAR